MGKVFSNIAEPDYVLIDTERAAYWRPHRAGYTFDLREAGTYTRTEALEICANARGGWRPGDKLRDVMMLVVDAQRIEQITPAPIERKLKCE